MIPSGTSILSPLPVAETVEWITQLVGQEAWLKRADKLVAGIAPGSFQLASCMERHHVELCIATALREIFLTGKVTTFDQQPHADAFAFAGFTLAIHRCLTGSGQRRHRGKLKEALGADFGFAALRTEQYGIILGLKIGCNVDPIDLDGGARYDLAFHDGVETVEVECKLLTHDFANRFTYSEFHRFCRELEKIKTSLLPRGTSCIAWLTIAKDLPKQSENLADLARLVAAAIAKNNVALPSCVTNLRIEEWPKGLEDPTRADSEARFLMLARHRDTFALHSDDAAFILALNSSTADPDRFEEQVERKFKTAADQLTGVRPGIIYAEVEGPSVDNGRIRELMQVFRLVMPTVFRARPFLQAVVIGFPGPPFSAGGSFFIRNNGIKRRKMSIITLKLERLYRRPKRVELPFQEFRDLWWQRKYQWGYKSENDIKAALEETAAEILASAKRNDAR